ncbi:hypothetical protein WCD74_17260 [Actinomycetospora sp. OC33-EN08]|uniref:Uncharacterized protein n=1 Tax=Actinomycetospora aurantiaca TaxID=3129233 RepID=A0ABU8MSX2_9PSEU
MSSPVPPGLYSEPPRGVSAIPTPAPQASDPTVLANGQVIPRQAMPTVGGGESFFVDLTAAPLVLRDLVDAREKLEELRQEAFRLGRVDPGVSDEVSRDAAKVLGLVAVGGSGSLLHALDGGVRRLDELIGALRAELVSYQGVEAATRAGIDGAQRT